MSCHKSAFKLKFVVSCLIENVFGLVEKLFIESLCSSYTDFYTKLSVV